MIHVTIQQLSSHLDGELSGASADLVKRHLAGCSECASKFAALEEQERLLSRVLTHDPGDAFFEQLVFDVEKLIGKRGTAGGAAIGAGAKHAPRNKAPVHRAEPSPTVAEPIRDQGDSLPSSSGHPAGRSVETSVRWIAATVLVVVFASVGFAVSRPDLMIHSWLQARAHRPATVEAPPAVMVAPPPARASLPAPTHARRSTPTHATTHAPATPKTAPGDVPDVAEIPGESDPQAEVPAEDDSQMDLSPEPVTMRADEIFAQPIAPQAPTSRRANTKHANPKISPVNEDNSEVDRPPPEAR